MKQAAKLIFSQMFVCENNVAIGLGYLLFCKTKYEFLKCPEIRDLDPYYNEQIALEISIF